MKKFRFAHCSFYIHKTRERIGCRTFVLRARNDIDEWRKDSRGTWVKLSGKCAMESIIVNQHAGKSNGP